MSLVSVVQEPSFARDPAAVQEIVRRGARALTGADGATFALKDGVQCCYAAEDSIAPLWHGMRFPLEDCISGWSMVYRHPAVIPDIYAEARIPVRAIGGCRFGNAVPLPHAESTDTSVSLFEIHCRSEKLGIEGTTTSSAC